MTGELQSMLLIKTLGLVYTSNSFKVLRFPTRPRLLNSLLTLAGIDLGRVERGGGSGMLSNNFRVAFLDLALEVVFVTDKDKGSVKLGCPK